MVRRLLAAAAAVTVMFVGVSAAPADAITLPAGDGAVDCAIVGAVRVQRPLATPDTWKIAVAAKIGGCTYNGNAIPFTVSGTTSTIVKASPSAVCAALADGSASASTRITVKVNGTTYLSASIPVAIEVSPSAPGSLVEVDGSGAVKGIALSGNVTAQTDRPLADLCNGAKKVLMLGTASLSWDRP